MGQGIITQRGIDTSDATATAEDIAINKTAYVDGVKIIGNRITKGMAISAFSINFGVPCLTMPTVPSSVSALTVHLLGRISVMEVYGGSSNNTSVDGMLLIEKAPKDTLARIRIFAVNTDQYNRITAIGVYSNYYADISISGNNVILTPTSAMWSLSMATGVTSPNNVFSTDAIGFIVE